MEGVAKQLFFGADQSHSDCSPQPLALSHPSPSKSTSSQSASPYGIRYGIPTDGTKKRVPPSTHSYRVPDSMMDESEDETETYSMFVERGICMLDPVEEQLMAFQSLQRQDIKFEYHGRCSKRQEAWEREEMQLAQALQDVSEGLREKEAAKALIDARHASAQHLEREQRVKELQRLHEKAAAVQQQQVDKLHRLAHAEREQKAREAKATEEARRQQLVMEQQRKAEADATEAKRVAELEATKARAHAQAQTQAQAHTSTAASRPTSGQPEPPKGTLSGKASAAARCMRVAPAAAKHESAVSKRMAQIQALLDPLVADESLKKQRRDIEKKMTVHVQQISATLDQVAKKCQDVYQQIASLPEGPWRYYALTQFATKVSRQSELIGLNNKAAFPLATVLVKVSTQFPALMDIMLAIMHKELVVAVPMSFVFDASVLTPAQHHRLMGYQEKDDPDNPGGKKFESTDDLCKRIEGLMLLYGAIVQVDDPAHPHGLGNGWQWLSWLLNAMPADRLSAKALICFLRTAGFTLYNRYRGQFIKLLKCMYDEFLPELGKLGQSDPDVLPLRTLLEHYLTSRQFEREPEGREMPRIDISSFTDRS